MTFIQNIVAVRAVQIHCSSWFFHFRLIKSNFVETHTSTIFFVLHLFRKFHCGFVSPSFHSFFNRICSFLALQAFSSHTSLHASMGLTFSMVLNTKNLVPLFLHQSFIGIFILCYNNHLLTSICIFSLLQLCSLICFPIVESCGLVRHAGHTAVGRLETEFWKTFPTMRLTNSVRVDVGVHYFHVPGHHLNVKNYFHCKMKGRSRDCMVPGLLRLWHFETNALD